MDDLFNTSIDSLKGGNGYTKDSFISKDKEGKITITNEFKECLNLMENTLEHIFITGDAGVGKSTLVKYFLKHTNKRVVVVAPTGVAALNIGGQTIHSFFQLPPRLLTRMDIPVISNPKKLKLYEKVDTIIIDEISMVSSNLMQSIHDFLLINVENAGEPFAGKQMILVGDLMQLPPVVSSKVARDVHNDMYGGKWFFDAPIWKNTVYHKIKLTKNFRQNDSLFIDLLNKVKYGTVEQEDIDKINERFVGRAMPTDSPVLCTLNKMVDAINQAMLQRIDSEYIKLVGKIEGDFNMKNCNTDEIISVKAGAKIMLLNNDPEGNWVNGTFGEFIGVERSRMANSDVVVVKIGDVVHRVEKVVYEQYKYDYDRASGSLSSKVVGTFEQFPIRVAFGISIHKCIEENQLIKTKRGWIPIKNIIPNIDYVLTHDGTYKKVLHKIYSGEQECCLVKTKSGLELEGTYKHPLLDHNGKWEKICDLNKECKIVNAFDQLCEYEGIYKPISYFMGYCVGDGSYTGYKHNDKYRIEIIISKDELENLENLTHILSSIGISYNIDHNLTGKNGKPRHVVRLRTHIKSFREKLFDDGLDYVKKQNKTIPFSILESNDMSSKASFLSGLWDSGGSCDSVQVRLNNISHVLLKQTQLMLSEFGIGSTLRPIKEGKLTKNKAHVLRIANDDLTKFRDIITLTCKHKKHNLDVLCEKYGTHGTSQYWVKYYTDDIIQNIKKHKVAKQFSMGNFMSKYSVEKYRDLTGDVSYDNYGKKIIRDDIIESITPIGVKKTYDIEVEGNHSFVAQGLVCHNSQGCTLDKAHIDFGDNPAFDHGQVYVALSRCRTFEGITLARKLTKEDIKIDPRIKYYMKRLTTFDNI